MSVEDLSTNVVYLGNGTTIKWPYTFPIEEGSDIEVWITDASGTNFPAKIPTLISTNYQVDTINGQVLYPIIGNPLASDGSTIELLRVLPLTQEVVLTNTGPLPAKVLENALDKLTMICQQIMTFIQNQCVQVPSNPAGVFNPTLPAGTAYVPGTGLVINANGTGWVLSAVATPASGSRIYRDPLIGSINGSNRVFTVSANFVSGTEELFMGGILQDPSTDYSVTAANQVTFTTAPQKNQMPLRMSYTTT